MGDLGIERVELMSLRYPIHLFFFFSSRRRHTRCSRDWSSDVCSSDLVVGPVRRRRVQRDPHRSVRLPDLLDDLAHGAILPARPLRRERRIIRSFVDGSVQTLGKERVMATQTGATASTTPEARTMALAQEGLIAGLVGAATIAVWFLLLDSLSGRPLYTPTVLGTA